MPHRKGRPTMDKKDEIIIQQLELIKTMTEHNLSRMADDIWGGSLGNDKNDKKPDATPE